MKIQYFLIKRNDGNRRDISVKKYHKKMRGVLYGGVQEFWVRRCIIITTTIHRKTCMLSGYVTFCDSEKYLYPP